MKSTAVLIPAYEPDEKLIRFIGELKKSGLSVIVVDDGSGPAYEKIFEQAKKDADVISYAKNRGKGFALRTGLRHIAEKHSMFRTVVTADADGQHKTADVMRTADSAEVHPGSLILGCRSFTGNVPLRSRMGNGITRMVFRMASGVRLSDTQTGLRAFGSDLIPFLLKIEGDRYEYEMNMLMEAARNKIPIGEVKIETVYLNDNAGSHFNTLRDSYLIYRDILKFTASSFASFCLDYVMFLIFSFLLGGLGTAASAGYANVFARIVSAGFNYTVNKKFVFREQGHTAGTLLQYVLLAAGILLFNTILLEFLITTVGMNHYAAKILTELTFFILSFTTQKFIIFRKKEETRA